MASRFAGLGLGGIFQDAFFSQAWPAHRANPATATPGVEMSGRAPMLDAYRQAVPRWAGGYSKKYKQDLQQYTTSSQWPENARRTFALGQYPSIDGGAPGEFLPQNQLSDAEKRARLAAQVAGATTADLTSQGLQNIYWFLNAWETLGMTAGRYGYHNALSKVPGAKSGSPFSGRMSTSAVFPLILGAGAASGTLFRQPGYEAVLPDRDGDRRNTTDPIAERAYRIIGRHGRLLPYKDFVQERPDVTEEEHRRYRAYLYGDRSILKGTMDGIHGPEVNFLGRSMPVLTGMLPLAGGVLGGRIGLQMAGRALASKDAFNEQKRLDSAVLTAREAAKDAGTLNTLAGDPRLKAAVNQQFNHRHRLTGRLLGGAIAGSSIGLGVTAAGAQLLEQMRRSAKVRERAAAQEDLGSQQA